MISVSLVCLLLYGSTWLMNVATMQKEGERETESERERNKVTEGGGEWDVFTVQHTD